MTLASGERIAASTVVWTAGVKATTLTQQIPGPKDGLGRLQVDQHLRAEGAEHIFATGDAAYALADKDHYALMSCQHALQLGRVSGHNAMADLIGDSLVEYSQEAYVCCLDLGSWGACVSIGWDRKVKLTGERAKRVKRYINQELIYPPDDAGKAIKMAGPTGIDMDHLIASIMLTVE